MIAKQKVIENQQLFAVTRIFSSTLFREFAHKAKSPLFARLAKQTSELEIFDLESTVGSFFDSAFKLLKSRNNRHEYIYKAAITKKILLGRHSLQTAVMLNEFRVNNNKADTVILNGTSTVYEIKSERDTLNRLEKQIDSYRKAFIFVNVITGHNHIENVKRIVPKEVGVLLLNDRFQISIDREATASIKSLSAATIFESIQLCEAKEILLNMGVEIPKLPNTQMYQALRNVFIKLSPIDAHEQMVKTLRESRDLSPLSEFINLLPDSIQATALSTPIKRQSRIKVLEALETPMHQAILWG